MARKEKRITLTEGETRLDFVIRQMPLTKLELFSVRLIALLAASTKDAPEFGSLADGLDWLRRQSAQALLSCIGNLDADRLKPLLDELLACCSRVVGAMETPCTPDVIDEYLSEIESLLVLRKEALIINFGFFTRAIEKLSASPGSAPG